MTVKPWSERKRTTEQIVGEVFGKLSAIPGIQAIATTPSPLPGGGQFPVEFVIASTAEPRELLEFANQLVMKAFASGLYMYADTDLKFDQPQSEIVFDRDKVASLGVNLQQVGADLGTMLGGNYVSGSASKGAATKSFRRSPASHA